MTESTVVLRTVPGQHGVEFVVGELRARSPGQREGREGEREGRTPLQGPWQERGQEAHW